MFLQDVEENDELRKEMALYKAQEKRKREKDAMETENEAAIAPVTEEEDDDDGESLPKIDMEELLDDFDGLSVGDEE